jgi:CRP-like cAMP-binding protein
MAIDALVKPLLALPIFQGLKPLQLTEIVRRAERIIYRAGDVIVSENQQSDAAIVIISGSCIRLDEASNKTDRTRGELVPEGSMIAELAMLVEIVHSGTIIAEGQVKALRITREKMHALLEQDANLAQHFSSLILERLQLLAEELSAVESLLPDQSAVPASPTRLRNVESLEAAY